MKGMSVLNPSHLISSIPNFFFSEATRRYHSAPYHNLAKQQELASLTSKG
jgi:hypothetical protein